MIFPLTLLALALVPMLLEARLAARNDRALRGEWRGRAAR